MGSVRKLRRIPRGEEPKNLRKKTTGRAGRFQGLTPKSIKEAISYVEERIRGNKEVLASMAGQPLESLSAKRLHELSQFSRFAELQRRIAADSKKVKDLSDMLR
ncbi:MAG: hypothetical protein ABIA76_02470 [Candidatus Diapherotrites archaeon]